MSLVSLPIFSGRLQLSSSLALARYLQLLLHMVRYNVSESANNCVVVLCADIFSFSTHIHSEATFLIGPNKHKALAMATNIFLTGVASYLNKILIIFTTDWFVAADGSTNLR